MRRISPTVASSASQTLLVLGRRRHAERALVQRRAEGRPDAVGQPALGAHLGHQARREVRAAEHVVHQRHRVPGRIDVLDAGVTEDHRRLRQVGAIDQQDARRLHRRHLGLGARGDRRLLPGAEGLLQLAAQPRRIDVAGHGQDGVVGAVERLPERHQSARVIFWTSSGISTQPSGFFSPKSRLSKCSLASSWGLS